MTDLQSRFAGPLAAPHHAVSQRRTRRAFAAPAGQALRRGPGRRLILAATSGEGMALGISGTGAAGDGGARRDVGRAALSADLPRPVRRQHREDARHAGRDGGVADRRLSDREPLLHPAVAARAVAAFHRARRSASWPIVLYNIPYRTAVNLDNETLLSLPRHPNIVGMKDCCADRAQAIDFLARRPPAFVC